MHVCTYVCMYVCKYVCMYVRTCVICAYACLNLRKPARSFVCVCKYVHMYVSYTTGNGTGSRNNRNNANTYQSINHDNITTNTENINNTSNNNNNNNNQAKASNQQEAIHSDSTSSNDSELRTPGFVDTGRSCVSWLYSRPAYSTMQPMPCARPPKLATTLETISASHCLLSNPKS